MNKKQEWEIGRFFGICVSDEADDSMNKKREWEIWWATIRYDDHPEISKVRPVLVISSEATSDGYIVCLKITSQGKKSEEDYTIPNWKELGLKKESTICITSGIREISPEDFMEKVGKLSPSDRWEVQERWESYRQRVR